MILMKILTILWLVFIILLSHISRDSSLRQSGKIARFFHINEDLLRHGAHIICYFVLTILAIASYSIWALIICILIALLDEISKIWLNKDRHCDIRDVFLNFMGVGLGVAIVFIFGLPR